MKTTKTAIANSLDENGVGGLLAVAVTDCPATNSPTPNSSLVTRHSSLYFPLYDANGNITAYVSETGEVVAQYAYDGFGRTLSATGPMADTFRHRFSTKHLDDETGFYYYGRRYYAPELARWTTRDPIGEDGGLNLYSFCGNDPINSWDALGNSIDDSEFENLGGLNYYDFRYQYVKAGGRRNPDLQNGFTSAVVSYKVDPEPCHEQACVKMIITQDVKIKGSMGWRLFVESYDPRIGPPSYEYDPRKQYTGRSGRTAKRHEELHLEHAIYHATQLDEELHNIATETCLSLKCYDAKEKYLKAVDTYYFFVRIHDDYELDFEDYPIEEANLLKKDLTFYANRVLKNGERLHQAQRKMEEVCR